MTRRYNPVHIAAFLYLLSISRVRKPTSQQKSQSSQSNESKSRIRDGAITLIDSELAVFCDHRVYGVDVSLSASWSLCNADALSVLVERDVEEARDALSNVRTVRRHPQDLTVMQLLRYLRLRGQRCVASNRYADIVTHNLSTKLYQTFLESVSFMLFSDNLHSSRGELSDLEARSIVQEYMRYHRMMRHLDTVVQPNKFRFVVLPRPTLLMSRPSETHISDYIFQPWYRGFHVVVNSTPTKTRCYNRHAELLQGWLALERFGVHACFEAVILPLGRGGDKVDDSNGYTCRSWRYWKYRSSYCIVIVDVLRYEGVDLLGVPFERRLDYLSRIQSSRTRTALVSTVWRDIESLSRTEDMYASVRGVIARHRLHVPLGRYDPRGDTIVRDEEPSRGRASLAELSRLSVFGYLFPVRAIAYDVYERCSLLPGALARLQDYRCPHFNLDVAPHSFVVQVYGHEDRRYFVCAYNVTAHQFEHIATLRRFEADIALPRYRAERIYVEGARVKTRGLFYLRLYFDAHQNFLGYEHKATLGKHDVSVDCFARLLRMANVLPD